MALLEIRRQHLDHNLTTLSLKAGSKERLAAVLKDNAYGHGLEPIASLCASFGIPKAVVRTADEAQRITEYFDDVVILNDRARKHPKWRFALNTLEDIAQAQAGARVDLKIDTGMHRNGIAIDELDEALRRIDQRGLELVGVMTHYRSADVLSSEYFWQKKRFDAIRAKLDGQGLRLQYHSHNSAALLRCNDFDEDFARVGIAMYGYDERPDVWRRADLKPVMRLVAERIATRHIGRGERVGYGGDFVAPHDMTVSTYDIGYGDGWRRGDAHAPFVTAEGKAILGRVSMDMLTLEGDADRVCLFEDAQEAARQFGTISYEVMTALSPHIKRVVVS